MSRTQSALAAWRDAERSLAAAADAKLVPRLARRLEQARDGYRRAVSAEERRTPPATEADKDGRNDATERSDKVSNIVDRTAIETGCDVYGSDGGHIGVVDEVGDDYILVQKGLIFVHDLFIPVSAIDRVEGASLYLQIPKKDVETRGWDQPPASYEQHMDVDRPVDRIAVHEEELVARKTVRQAGEVQIRKDVVEEERTIDVPVTREEVQVSRHAVDRPATDAEAAFRASGDTIRVPVMEEDVEVTKRPRVKEEIEISKVARQDTARVSDTVRREEVEVINDTDSR